MSPTGIGIGLSLSMSMSMSAPAPEDKDRVGVAPIELLGDVSRKVSTPAHKRLQESIDEDFEVVEVPAGEGCDLDCLAEAAREADVPAVVQVQIAVKNRDYTLRTRVVNAESGEVLREDENSCEICTYDESLEVLDQQLTNVGSALHHLLDEEPEALPVAPPDPDRYLLPVNGRRLRIGGWTMVGVGAATTIGGIALAVVHDDDGPRTVAPGAGMLVGGIALVGGGVGLVLVDRRGRKRAAATLTPTARGVVIHGRF